MTSPAWSRVCEIFHEVIDLSPGERPRTLDEECRDDRALRREVQRLVELHDRAGEFLERPLARLLPDPESPTPRAGDQVGAYRLVRRIGGGGMGVVFEAERADDVYEKRVAIKFLRAELLTPDLERRFAYERQALADLDHPAVAWMIDGGTTEQGSPYIVMELVDGLPLTTYCEREQLDLEARVELFSSICRGIRTLHRRGIIHGDIKPPNLLVTHDGDVRIVDLGLAFRPHTTPEGERVGRGLTPPYASPEQQAGEPLTTTSDVYSLGVVLFELVVGRRPGARPLDPELILHLILRADIPGRRSRRTLARHLGSIIDHATARDPESRYGAVEELATDIERVLKRIPPRAMEGHPFHRSLLFLFKHRRLATTGAVLVVGATLTMIVVDRTTEERIETTRHYVGEAREIEYESRLESMLPRHDIRPFRRSLRHRVAGFEERLDGRWDAPVHYAIGIGRLELGEHEAARRHLQSAWNGGFRNPDVARALLVTLGNLYREDVRDTKRTFDTDARERRLRAVIEEYRPSMSRALDRVEDARDPKSREARVLAAHLVGQPELALEWLESLEPREEYPRANILEGHIRVFQADELAPADASAALALLESAGDSYARGKVVWRSDLELHVADCDRAVTETVLRWRVGETAVSLDPALDRCAQAAEISPGLVDVELARARLFAFAAQEELYHGRDPASLVRSGMESLDRVQDTVDRRGAVAYLRAMSLNQIAKWRLRRGRNPLPVLDEARPTIHEALAAAPHDAMLWNTLGTLSGVEVRYREGLGEPITEPLSRAIDAFERALEIESYAVLHVNLGVSYQKRAALATVDGQDPSEWLAASEHHYRESLRLAPNRAILHERAAGLDLLRARLTHDLGGDALHLDHAVARLRRSLELDPVCLDCRLTLADALLLRAESRGGEIGLTSIAEAERILSSVPPTARARDLETRAARLRDAPSPP